MPKTAPRMSTYARHVDVQLTDSGLPAGNPGFWPLVVPDRAAVDGHDITPLLRSLPRHNEPYDGPPITIETGPSGECIVTLTLRANAVQRPDRNQVLIEAPDGTHLVPLCPKPPKGKDVVRPVGGTGEWVKVSMFCESLTIGGRHGNA